LIARHDAASELQAVNHQRLLQRVNLTDALQRFDFCRFLCYSSLNASFSRETGVSVIDRQLIDLPPFCGLQVFGVGWVFARFPMHV
jgi:hypothetical protein